MGPQNILVLDESIDSDTEELPLFSFLQKKNCSSALPVKNVVVLESSGSESSKPSSPVHKGGHQERQSANLCDQDITMISSESEEEEMVVSLSERLKHRFAAVESYSKAPTFPVAEPGSASNCSEPIKVATTAVRAEKAQGHLMARSLGLYTAQKASKDTEFDRPPVYQSSSLVHSAQPQEDIFDKAPSKKKVKRTLDEMEAGHREALKRRREREKHRAGKENLEQEKARRKQLADAVRAQRPEECMKYVQVLIDPDLLQVEGGGLLLSALQTMECSCLVESRPVPYSISWRRRASDLQGEDSIWVEDPSLLVLVPQRDFISMVQRSQKDQQSGAVGGLQTLKRFSASLRQKSDGKSTCLVVVEMEKYFKCQKTQSQKKLRQVVLGGAAGEGTTKQRRKKAVPDTLPLLSRVDVEEALVEVQLHTGVQVRFLETWKEVGEFASMFTKAVAEAPFKQQRDSTSFSFYLENDWSGGVRVDRSGHGLLQVWKRQIQQFNRVSVEIANAVAATYPSPQLLAQAYRVCASLTARHDLLSDILVRRGEGVTSTSRRVGPELSKRIYLQLTCLNPELSLDVTA